MLCDKQLPEPEFMAEKWWDAGDREHPTPFASETPHHKVPGWRQALQWAPL